jgi:hypothetical protein
MAWLSPHRSKGAGERGGGRGTRTPMGAVSSRFRAGPKPAATRAVMPVTRRATRPCFPLLPTVGLHDGLHP